MSLETAVLKESVKKVFTEYVGAGLPFDFQTRKTPRIQGTVGPTDNTW